MPTPPKIRAATWKERAMDSLKRLGSSVAQQPVVRAAGAVAQQIDEGFRGQMGQEDSPWAGPKEGQQVAATVFHGSPHLFRKFDASKIGTGEGAQAKGHGLYFAENPEVGRSYQRALAPGRGTSPVDVAARVEEAVGGNLDLAIEEIRRRAAAGHATPEFRQAMLEAERAIRSGATKSHFYDVDLPDDAIAKMLDWDAPLSQQAGPVRAFAEKRGIGGRPGDFVRGDPAGEHIYRRGAAYLGSGGVPHEAARSAEMLAEGIPGIKYYDGMSRGVGQGSRNYVVFDDQLPKILKINGMDPDEAIRVLQARRP